MLRTESEHGFCLVLRKWVGRYRRLLPLVKVKGLSSGVGWEGERAHSFSTISLNNINPLTSFTSLGTMWPCLSLGMNCWTILFFVYDAEIVKLVLCMELLMRCKEHNCNPCIWKVSSILLQNSQRKGPEEQCPTNWSFLNKDWNCIQQNIFILILGI